MCSIFCLFSICGDDHTEHLGVFFSELLLGITLTFNVLIDTIATIWRFIVLSFFLSCALKSLVLPRNLRPHFILSEVRSSLHPHISTKHHGPSSTLAPTMTCLEAPLFLILLIRLLSILPYCCVFALTIYYYIMWSHFLVFSFLLVLEKLIYLFQPLHLY